ncbi:hypothetical protein PR048_016543 [Dryococelus australis]|uniref:Uncharacterized protein n=1 Tax=Dryococelus australis TaxID=614101 RepID=A0ABQ9HJZ6_9NEOP|nr:hypothetical protein PR048_016543 [Dryococelus australis]
MDLFAKLNDQEYSTNATFLMGFLIITPVQLRHHEIYDNSYDSRRQGSVRYTIPNGKGDLLRVCKITFMVVFAAGKKKRLEILIKMNKRGNITFTDHRTRHAPSKYSETYRICVKQHINSSFAKLAITAEEEYLSPGVNISILYLHLKEKFPETMVSDMYYRRPKQVLCSQKQHTRSTVKRQAETHSLFKSNISSSQHIDSDTCSMSMDLQQVMFVSTLTQSEMIYHGQ